jgi:hypothetical protein
MDLRVYDGDFSVDVPAIRTNALHYICAAATHK